MQRVRRHLTDEAVVGCHLALRSLRVPAAAVGEGRDAPQQLRMSCGGGGGVLTNTLAGRAGGGVERACFCPERATVRHARACVSHLHARAVRQQRECRSCCCASSFSLQCIQGLPSQLNGILQQLEGKEGGGCFGLLLREFARSTVAQAATASGWPAAWARLHKRMASALLLRTHESRPTLTLSAFSKVQSFSEILNCLQSPAVAVGMMSRVREAAGCQRLTVK